MLEPGTYKLHGIDWVFDGHYWKADTHERFHLLIWQFGDIWQCTLKVDYENLIEPEGWDFGNRIGLVETATRDEAMIKAMKWVESFLKEGLDSPEVLFQNCYMEYPDLYKRRIDVINHIFFTIGGGYNWLDGQIYNESPEKEEGKSMSESFDIDLSKYWETSLKAAELLKDYGGEKEQELFDEEKRKHAEMLLEKKIKANPEKYLPLTDHGEPYNFYPVSESSNILTIPIDVTDEWLSVCYEAVKLFTDRNSNPRNAKLQKTFLKHFEEKYKERLQRMP